MELRQNNKNICRGSFFLKSATFPAQERSIIRKGKKAFLQNHPETDME